MQLQVVVVVPAKDPAVEEQQAHTHKNQLHAIFFALHIAPRRPRIPIEAFVESSIVYYINWVDS